MNDIVDPLELERRARLAVLASPDLAKRERVAEDSGKPALAPIGHARLGPSKAKGWFECAGRLKMEEPYPDESNEFADEGTACHEVAAWCLTEHYRASKRVGDWITVSRADEPLRRVQFTDDMAEWVQAYVDHVRVSSINASEVQIERRLSFGKFIATEDAFGTTDAGIVNLEQQELQIEDLKTGWRHVEVTRNPQLMIYALATLGELYERALRVQAATGGDDDLF